MLVFGGTTDWETGMNDVWSLRLLDGWEFARWEKREPSGTPPRGRYDHGAAYMPDRETMIVFGGQVDVQNQTNDAWALELAQDPPHWSRIDAGGASPPPLAGVAAAYSQDTGDPEGTTDGMIVIQGGQVGGDARDQTWALVCGVPTPTPPTTGTAETGTPTTQATSPTPGTPSTPATATASPTPSPTNTESPPTPTTPTDLTPSLPPTEPTIYLPATYANA
jgi:hypothetical protein